METYCGANCEACGQRATCRGCVATCGKPFGGDCVAAECVKVGGREELERFKRQIIDEFNALGVDGMPKITELYCLLGSYVNLEYPLPSGGAARFLDDRQVYLGTQVPAPSDRRGARCFGLVAGRDFLLVAAYGEGGADPEIVAFRKRTTE